MSAGSSLAGRDCRIDLTTPRIMGVLNVTPDSFSDGGCYLEAQAAVAQGLSMAEEGAAILDIGGESTRPGAAPVSAAEELDRVIPVIEALRRTTDLPLSIDTSKALVAREALAAGVNFINDISGLTFDPEMIGVAVDSGAGLFLMHTRGRPDTMQQDTRYSDLLGEVIAGLRESRDAALDAGVPRDRLAVDPGIGFGKSVSGNLELLAHLVELQKLGCPILLGTSRKSFLGHLLHRDNPQQRLAGSLGTVAWGVMQGVQLFRVHDVAATRDLIEVIQAIRIAGD